MSRTCQAVIKVALSFVLAMALGACKEDFGPDQHGRNVSFESLDGQWLVINYWAQWCRPCRTEIPELNRLATTLESEAIRVVGVNFDALQGEALAKAADEFGISFTVLAQDPAARLGLPAIAVLPVTFIVDPEGQVREQLVGEQTQAGLLAHLERLHAR